MHLPSYPPGTVSWVDLRARDVPDVARFYASLLGWRMDRRDQPDSLLCLLRGRSVAGIAPLLPPMTEPAWTTYVCAADAEATLASVTRHGGRVLTGPVAVGREGRLALFLDPAGAVTGIWEPGRSAGAGIINEPGALCWTELATCSPEDAPPFYEAVFGWEPAPQPMPDGTTYTAWILDGRAVGGISPSPLEAEPSRWMPYFEAADVDAIAEAAPLLGGEVLTGPADEEPGRVAVVRDPQGATFSVISMRTDEDL